MKSNLHVSEPAFAAPHTAAPSADLRFARDVLAGLSRSRKTLPCTWLYDHRGSELFEAITALPEYYPTRTETMILRSCAAQIAELAGPRATVIELGSGSSRKTPLLLAALDAPALYMPIDISAQFLHQSVQALQPRFAHLAMQPLVADFTRPLALPARGTDAGRRLVFFPGSTIGNFAPDAAEQLLRQVAQAVGREALLVLGADGTQDPAVLLPAYDDAQGVTAAFNLNLLTRMNRELGADFNLGAFRHEARFNAHGPRVEMHLVSRTKQVVHLLGRRVHFAQGESIHTENSYKHGPRRLKALALRAGWVPRQLWMDAHSRFAVHVFECTDLALPGNGQ